MTLLRPWSIFVKIVWAIPVELETIFVIPIPTRLSDKNLETVSFVMLFLTSSTITSPIKEEDACDLVSLGSDLGLSLAVCGYRSFTGWEYFSSVNGATVGEFEEFKSVM